VTRPPFGFGPSDRPDEPNDPRDPFGLAGLFGGGAGGMGEMLGQLQKLMSWTGGPVNWDLATEIATTATRAKDRPVTPAESAEVVEACRLADLWLDPVTTLPATGARAEAWTRTGWVESTLPAWRQLVDPVAGRVVAAMGGALEQGLAGGALGLGGLTEGLPPEVAGLLGGLGGGAGGLAGALGPLKGVMDQVGGFVFGAQVGQALGELAGEVLSATEIGLPLAAGGRPALLPANVAAFADGLDVPIEEVRLYLALRESAHARLFASVPWLKAHLFDAVDAYARGITIDPGAIERAVGSIDPSDPASMQRAMGEGLFDSEPTPAQQAALARLETALALVEGWVDAVVDAAATGTLPAAVALRETVRRRRASGGPAEQTFATLVGLQLRPRRLREAAALWAAVALESRGGIAGRDALWAHPDLLPTAADLDDPLGFAAGAGAGRAGSGSADDAVSETDWDAGLRSLDKDLDGSLDDDATVVRPRTRRASRGAVARSRVRQVETGRGGHALEVAAGALGPRVALDQRPEPPARARARAGGPARDQHVVDHPLRHALQPRRQPDGPLGRRARAQREPCRVVQRSLAGRAPPLQPARRQLRCALLELVVARAAAARPSSPAGRSSRRPSGPPRPGSCGPAPARPAARPGGTPTPSAAASGCARPRPRRGAGVGWVARRATLLRGADTATPTSGPVPDFLASTAAPGPPPLVRPPCPGSRDAPSPCRSPALHNDTRTGPHPSTALSTGCGRRR
jgi:putative hydrolase